MKKINKNYNDGVVYIYQEKAKKSSFSAKENCKTIEDLMFIVKLNFQEMSKRQQDVMFAESLGNSLSMKIRTPFRDNVKNRHKAIINNYLYNISYIDPDKKNNDLYIYLEGVGEIVK